MNDKIRAGIVTEKEKLQALINHKFSQLEKEPASARQVIIGQLVEEVFKSYTPDLFVKMLTDMIDEAHKEIFATALKLGYVNNG